MKMIVKKDEKVKSVEFICNATEALFINHAMLRYTLDKQVDVISRKIVEEMLGTEPIYINLI